MQKRKKMKLAMVDEKGRRALSSMNTKINHIADNYQIITKYGKIGS